jgi:predicted amidohydrolase YtcJ
VEAISIRGGRVAAAGTLAEVEAAAGPGTKRRALAPGEVALPAMTDAHIHLVDTAIAAESIDVFQAATLDDALRLVAEAAARIPAPGWILGSGWDQRRWGAWPNADMLERVAPGRHVALRSFDLHALWASPAALAAAGIDAGSPDPPGGIYRRDADGEPDGIMFEKASEVVLQHAPPPTPEMLRRAIRSIGRSCLELGVVGVHELGTLFPDTANGALNVYASLADAGELQIRVHAGVRADGLENALERGLRSGSRIGEADPSRLAFGWLKLFADGTLGSRTAALLEPREGSSERGLLTNAPEFLRERTNRAAAAGIATTIHTIGDAAVRIGLDVLGPTSESAAFMPRLEHVQLCHPDDRRRFAQLGVAASVQPIHLREDAPGARRDWGDRAESNGYTWQSLRDAGATLAFGQDAPLEPLDPWPGIALSVLRRDPTWDDGDAAFGPREAISLEEALRASIVGPWQTLRDPLGGRLVPGSLADVMVLPSMPTEELLRSAEFDGVRPRLVLVDGEVALERSS